MGGQSETISRPTQPASGRGTDGAVGVPLRRGRRGTIDAFDLAIIGQLSIDGRMSTKRIAEEVGLTDATVATRVRALAERDVLRVRAIVDWDVAGLRSPIVFFVRVRGRSSAGIAERLLADPHVHSVAEVFGSADLVVRVLLADPTDAMAFAEETLRGIDGIELVMSLLDVDVAKHANGYHTGAEPPTQVPTFPAGDLVDDLDIRVLEHLLEDARQSLRQIGRALDVSEHTVRSRLRRMEDVGLVRICAQIDHEAMTTSTESAYLALRTERASTAAIIDDLVARPEFRTVDRTLGEYDVLALVAGSTRGELADLVDSVRSAPGVLRSETWLVVDQQLAAFPWARF